VFALYGVLIGSIPVLVTNVVISGLDVWYLRKELTTRENLTVIPVEASDPFLEAFVTAHHDDIVSYATDDTLAGDADIHLVMLRNEVPAGVFIGRSDHDAALDVVVDYVAPAYRDHKSGASLYRVGAARFADVGFSTVRVANVDKRQRWYYEDMGFAHLDDGGMQLTVGEG
jgi:GNAT superfamily N-acetyltransferase